MVILAEPPTSVELVETFASELYAVGVPPQPVDDDVSTIDGTGSGANVGIGGSVGSGKGVGVGSTVSSVVGI